MMASTSVPNLGRAVMDGPLSMILSISAAVTVHLQEPGPAMGAENLLRISQISPSLTRAVVLEELIILAVEMEASEKTAAERVFQEKIQEILEGIVLTAVSIIQLAQVGVEIQIFLRTQERSWETFGAEWSVISTAIIMRKNVKPARVGSFKKKPLIFSSSFRN
jgi:hypothetical protein